MDAMRANGLSVIKQVIQPITLPLIAIFNMSFQTGVFPSSMKLAKIIPIVRSSSKAEFNNYIPIISVIPIF